ncbi:zinc finger protein basonuclin-2-like [Neocloeon triangulifer]|uniref:zinc finger protein basonuclin-2-like n=1 Tax=Neocloeon triangulifer TaxID=2078957 RepID=UPI00286EF04B|nr:zinc finger protein basonuclin-2-like [Neocloeon triangulifer]
MTRRHRPRPRRRQCHRAGDAPPTVQPNAAPSMHPLRLAPLNWASVASWFLRPPPPRLSNGHASPLNTAIRCTVPGCPCDCFVPGKLQLRQCDSCKHGWVPHALDKLGLGPAVEPVQASVAFDVASLVLYGCQALPIRLKILLDRVFSVLQRDEVLQVLHGFGWSHDDYSRGYILQDSQGGVLERWNMCSREEEPLVLQQFLRFGETRAITQQLLALDAPPPLPPPALRPHASDIKRFISQTPPLAKKPARDPLAFLKAPPPSAPPTPTASPASSAPSPLSISPLNRLQSMQPLDFRKEKTPDRSRAENKVLNSLNLTRSDSDIGSDDENSALNLSRDGPESSARAIKRQWSPLGATLINPATGKKRVQCSVCMKTFCDKGALKIHFSAVHLREMHKCTVDGCNMMFSSRRSRNRHSANPNPKLHSPHLRRKISPHDGRSSIPHPLLLPPPPLMGLTFAPRPQFSAPHLDFSSGGSISSEEAGLGDSDSVEAPAKQRKRKNQHPTRIAAPSSDDSSASSSEDALRRLEGLEPPFRVGLGLGHQPPPAPGSDDAGDDFEDEALRCSACGQHFDNHFGAKMHFQDVHLKLMHRCSVDGCNAAFPSKRSRDRHSANLNLHRKLLSTTDRLLLLSDFSPPHSPLNFEQMDAGEHGVDVKPLLDCNACVNRRVRAAH